MADKQGRKTGGRKAGTPNKATADLKALAQDHAETCIARLLRIVKGKNDVAAAAAIKIILAYGYGQPRAAVDVSLKPVYAISDRPLTSDEWEREFASTGDSVDASRRTTTSTRKVRSS